MNLKEAKKSLSENLGVINFGIKPTNPPHLVLDLIIAPSKIDLTVWKNIYHRIKELGKNNEQVLIEMDLQNENLDVFIIYEISGSNTFQEVEDYKKSVLFYRG